MNPYQVLFDAQMDYFRTGITRSCKRRVEVVADFKTPYQESDGVRFHL
jgi:hypothetical protein